MSICPLLISTLFHHHETSHPHQTIPEQCKAQSPLQTDMTVLRHACQGLSQPQQASMQQTFHADPPLAIEALHDKEESLNEDGPKWQCNSV